jgi:hypothetical protein
MSIAPKEKLVSARKNSLFQLLNLANSNKLRFDESHRRNKSIKKDGVILMVSSHVLNLYKPYTAIFPVVVKRVERLSEKNDSSRFIARWLLD